jgi:hypothetical protein
VDTTLVLVPVSVNDPLDRPVSGLEKENFRLFEDKVEQTISQFAMDDEPIAVGLVFDTSKTWSFGPQRRMKMPGSAADTGHGRIEVSLPSRSKGSTALLDAIYVGLHEIKVSRRQTRKRC